MNIIFGILFWIVLIAGVAVTPIGFPGTFIIAVSVLIFDILTDFEGFNSALIFFLFALAILMEILEASLSGYMAKRFGGSKFAIIGAIAGGLIGAIWGTMIFPVVGTLLGAFIGAFSGAFLGEYFLSRDFDRSLLAGIGAFIGAIGGKTMKTIAALAMVVTVGFYYF